MIEFVKHKYSPRWYYCDTFADERVGGYYFWDETGTECYGPYETEEQCRSGMEAYALSLES